MHHQCIAPLAANSPTAAYPGPFRQHPQRWGCARVLQSGHPGGVGSSNWPSPITLENYSTLQNILKWFLLAAGKMVTIFVDQFGNNSVSSQFIMTFVCVNTVNTETAVLVQELWPCIVVTFIHDDTVNTDHRVVCVHKLETMYCKKYCNTCFEKSIAVSTAVLFPSSIATGVAIRIANNPAPDTEPAQPKQLVVVTAKWLVTRQVLKVTNWSRDVTCTHSCRSLRGTKPLGVLHSYTPHRPSLSLSDNTTTTHTYIYAYIQSSLHTCMRNCRFF